MGQLIESLGLDWRILFAQLLNFAILLFILYKLGYKPILKFVEERTKSIEDGVNNAEKAKTLLAEAEKKQEQLLAEARTEAQEILSKAKEQASQQGDALVAKSKAEAQKVVDKAKQDIRAEHAQMVDSAKQEISELILVASEKVLRKKIDETGDKEFVTTVINELK